MDDRATEIRNPVLDLLTLLRMALGQLRLYPASSPQAQKVILPAQAAVAGAIFAGKRSVRASRGHRCCRPSIDDISRPSDTRYTRASRDLSRERDAMSAQVSSTKPDQFEPSSMFTHTEIDGDSTRAECHQRCGRNNHGDQRSDHPSD